MRPASVTKTLKMTAERDAEITFQFADDVGDSSFIVNWQPGNGTWYRVMFTPMTPELVHAAGFSISGRKAWLVTWLIPGEPCASYILRADGFLSYDYICEKLCSKKGTWVDASEITRIIGAVFPGRAIRIRTDETGHGTESFTDIDAGVAGRQNSPGRPG